MLQSVWAQILAGILCGIRRMWRHRPGHGGKRTAEFINTLRGTRIFTRLLFTAVVLVCLSLGFWSAA